MYSFNKIDINVNAIYKIIENEFANLGTIEHLQCAEEEFEDHRSKVGSSAG
jgi:hypothetical protein